MAEAKLISFTYQEIVTALIKHQGIHEGLWGVYAQFGLGAANVQDPETQEVLPAAIVPIKELGIQQFPKPNNLTVDAAVVNPKPKSASARKTPKKKT